MLKCPFCRSEIPDGSHYCDQCGKKLNYCPECGKPRRGTECASCGALLVSPEAFFAKGPSRLQGGGLDLPLKEGSFGRRGGIWPELSSLQYVSGTHGKLFLSEGKWWMVDVGSTNGTRVNGSKLSPDVPCELNAGDRVRIATYEFVVK